MIGVCRRRRVMLSYRVRREIGGGVVWVMAFWSKVVYGLFPYIE